MRGKSVSKFRANRADRDGFNAFKADRIRYPNMQEMVRNMKEPKESIPSHTGTSDDRIDRRVNHCVFFNLRRI